LVTQPASRLEKSNLNFTHYPNPKNGLFRILYEPISNEPILIDFYDMQDRKVISKNILLMGFG
jgi:hypothetical protein